MFGMMAWVRNFVLVLYATGWNCYVWKFAFMVLQWEASLERPYGWDQWDCEKCDISNSKIGSSSCLHSCRIYRSREEVCPFNSCCLLTSEWNDQGTGWYKRSTKYKKKTLNIHKLVRRRNLKGESNITFFKVANEEDPVHVQWYGDDNQLIYGHGEVGNTDNDCSNCNKVYKYGEEWLRCPTCSQWFHKECFYEYRSLNLDNKRVIWLTH